MLARSDLERRFAFRLGLAVQLDELRRIDLLRDAVFFDRKVVGREIGDRLVPLARDGHIHPHDADHGALVREIDRVIGSFLRDDREPLQLGDLTGRNEATRREQSQAL